MIKMCDECRDFFDSLYPPERGWKDNEILDVLVYYGELGYLIKYHNDMVLLFERNGEHIKSFNKYEDFLSHIGANEKPEEN
jgi:hypothetical protein